MLSVTEIAAEVAQGNLPAVEAAFQALVGWPDVDAIGPPSPDVLAYILEHVAEALKHDTETMPAALVAALVTEGFDGQGADFAAGASFVLANLHRWRERFDSAADADAG